MNFVCRCGETGFKIEQAVSLRSGALSGQTGSELEGARGIEPPPGFLDRASGFAARGAPSTIAPAQIPQQGVRTGVKEVLKCDSCVMKEMKCIFRLGPVPTKHG